MENPVKVLAAANRPLPVVQGGLEGATDTAVELVQDKGDLLDQLTWLKRGPWLGSAALSGLAASGLQFGAGIDRMTHGGEIFLSSPTALVGGAVATGLTRPLARRWQRGRVVEHRESLNRLRLNMVGDSVEFFRQGTKKHPTVGVLWDPTQERTESYASIVAGVAELSQALEKHPIEGIAVPEAVIVPILKNADLSGYPDTSLTSVSRDGWINLGKKRKVTDTTHEDEQVWLFSKEKFAALAECLLAPDDNPIRSYMELLKELRPRHPSSRHFTTETLTDQAKLKALEHSLRRTVESRLQEVTAERSRPELETGAIPASSRAKNSDGAPTRRKVGVGGAIDIRTRGRRAGTVKWRTSAGLPTGETSGLLDHYGVTEAELTELPQNYRSMPRHRATELCELAAWLAVHDKLHPQAAGRTRPSTATQNQIPTRPESITVHSEGGVQARTADRLLERRRSAKESGISLRRLASRRLARTLVMASAAFGAGAAVSESMDLYVNHYFGTHLEKLYAQQSKDYDNKSIQAKIDKETNTLELQIAEKPLEQMYKVEDFVKNELLSLTTLQGYVPDEVERFAESVFQDQDNDFIGNVTRGGENKPVWYIESHNGMQSEGYWAEQTSRILGENPLGWVNYGIYDEVENDTIAEREFGVKLSEQMPLPLPDALDKSQPLLRLQRIISTSPHAASGIALAGNAGNEYKDVYGGDISKSLKAIPVPVLEGTHIVAASADGTKPLIIKKLKDGISVLLMHEYVGIDNQPVKLEYWLAPSDGAAPVRAVGPIQNYRRQQRTAVTKPWQPYLGDVNKLDPNQRLESEANYIKSEFTYKLQPLEDPKKTLADSETYATTVLKDETANCNVAGTLLAESNPEELNYATGFYNSNTPVQTKKNGAFLSSHEAHAWTVDRDGKIHDPTPGGANAQDQAFFKEGSAERFDSPIDQRRNQSKLLLEGLGILVLSGATYKLRRPARKATIRLRKDMAAITIAAISDQDSSTAYTVLSSAAHYGSEARIKSLGSLQRPVDEAKLEREWQWLVNSHESKKLKPQVRQALRVSTDSDVRRALRLGNTLQHLYRIRG